MPEVFASGRDGSPGHCPIFSGLLRQARDNNPLVPNGLRDRSAASRDYAPDYVSAETLAYRLDCSRSTIDNYVRLGLLPRPVMETIEDLRARKIGFRSLTENMDTTTAAGELMFHIFGALAQFERSLIKERVSAGLTAARSRGRVGGRPKVNTAALTHAKTLIAGGMTPSQACKTAGISRSTLYKHGDVRKTSDGAGFETNGFRTSKKTASGAQSANGAAVA